MCTMGEEHVSEFELSIISEWVWIREQPRISVHSLITAASCFYFAAQGHRATLARVCVRARRFSYSRKPQSCRSNHLMATVTKHQRASEQLKWRGLGFQNKTKSNKIPHTWRQKSQKQEKKKKSNIASILVFKLHHSMISYGEANLHFSHLFFYSIEWSCILQSD